MGREIFRVPPDWQHPKRSDGQYKPMHMDRSYAEEAAEWLQNAVLWSKGEHPDQQEGGLAEKDHHKWRWFWEWEDMPPDPEYYRQREWTEAEATHWQMYETTSEGTPISPVMESPESLARWLADTGASAFGGQTASYEHWLAMIVGPGWAPSGIAGPGIGVVSGVEGMARMQEERTGATGSVEHPDRNAE